MSRHAQRMWTPGKGGGRRYQATHAHHKDGSTAMMVAETEALITLINEEGYMWTDLKRKWREVE